MCPSLKELTKRASYTALPANASGPHTLFSGFDASQPFDIKENMHFFHFFPLYPLP